MSLFPCTACHERASEKYANTTLAYWNAANDRLAWRHKLCTACWASMIQPLYEGVQQEPFDCPVCHTPAGEALDPTYVTAYVPGYGKLQLELATCAVCAVTIRSRFQDGAEKLVDRRIESVGKDPGPQTDPATAAWAAMGILPRD